MNDVPTITTGRAAENGPVDAIPDAIMAAVKNMFTAHFTRVLGSVYGFRGVIDGKVVGVVAATKTKKYEKSPHHILNKDTFDNLVEGYDAKRLDYAIAVTAKVVDGKWAVIDMIAAHELAARLANVGGGELGDFYLVDAHFATEQEEGF
jgi:hypothetical protein